MKGDMTTRGRVLVVDDDPALVALIREYLHAGGWEVGTATTVAVARDAIARGVDVVLADLVLDDLDGIALVGEARAARGAPPVVLMTAFGDLASVTAALRAGARDYLTKPFRLADVTRALDRALADSCAGGRGERDGSHDGVIAVSSAMRHVLDQVDVVASTDAAVLLTGETGTGKELIARAIHAGSVRRNGPFVAINCAAMPEALLESELFGHVRGAFTGAGTSRDGLLAQAAGGTVLLDEIGDMAIGLQAKLLRVLQDKIIRPVGGTETFHVDFRLVSATHADLPALVHDGRFRADLYYRLAVFPIGLPALRERPEDIPVLARHFLRSACDRHACDVRDFTDDAIARLTAHSWPGNVRELGNVVERAAVFAGGPRITATDLRFDVSIRKLQRERPTLHELERQYIEDVLAQCDGDKRRAATLLNVSVRTLQRFNKRGMRAA